MKSMRFIVPTGLILLLIWLYALIPNAIVITETASISSSERAVSFFLTTKGGRNKWWPGKSFKKADSAFEYSSFNNYTYIIRPGNYSELYIEIRKDDFTGEGKMSFTVTGPNRVEIKWLTETITGLNPFGRIRNYLDAKKASGQMEAVLRHLKLFLEDERKVYGISIRKQAVSNPLILTMKKVSSRPLSTPEVYKMIAELKVYISESGAKKIGDPMLNSSRTGENEYQTMVGIPINKDVKGTGKIHIKRMLKNGIMLVTEVKGGRNTIDKAFAELENYKEDKSLASPAIPFESLVTDRLAEPDTSKWITRIFYPIY